MDIAFSPAKLASAMQLRTRKEHKFDEVEAGLPDPTAASLRLSQLSVTNIFDRIGNLNPFGRPVANGDIVWLLDNTAFKHSMLGSWQAEFVAAIFERDPKCKVADIVSGIASSVGLADDAVERKTIEERIMPFLWDVRTARIVKAAHNGKELKLGPTSVNGISTEVLKVSSSDKGSFVKAAANIPQGVDGITQMQTYYAGAEGWGIISGECSKILHSFETDLYRYRRYHQGHSDK